MNPGIPARVIWFVSIYFLTVLVLPLVIGGAVTYRSLPCGRECPHCRRSTLLLASNVFGLLSRLPGIQVQRRWCLHCGWLGVVRLARPSVRLVVEGRSADSRAAARVIDLRHLLVNGMWWRVRLETWRAGRIWYGRLVFVEPSGRVWTDAQPLMGTTDQEVLHQARRLPTGALASRLRGLVSR